MKCQVLLFANLAEAVGTDRLAIELPDGARVADALAQLCTEHEAIRDLRHVLAVAVNERYARPDAELAGGDVIALIPPVSGG